MPSYITSNLVVAQDILNKKFQSAELRQEPSPILALGMRGAPILMRNLEELRKREDRPIQAYLFKRTPRSTTGKIRTHDHTGPTGDSFSVDLQFTSFVDTFSTSLKQMDNNMFSSAEDLANLFSQAFQNIRNDIELALRDFLISEKTHVNKATKNGTFNATRFAFEIAATPNERGLTLEDAMSMMRQNYYSGVFDVIADAKLFRDFKYYAAQGAQNASNTSFQFSGANIMECVTLSDGSYTGGLGLVIPSGTFAMLDWIPKQDRQGHGKYEDVLGGYGSMIDPVSGLQFGIHAYTQRADRSTLNGSEQDNEMQFEVSVDISPNLAPLSTAAETPVYEIAQV